MTRGTFKDDARRLADATFAGDPIDSRVYESLRSSLARILLARYRALGADELLDIVDETILRLLRRAERGDANLENPSGWLATVAMNLARDRLRRRRHEPSAATNPISDDETARLIDRAASYQVIQQAIAEAIRRDDSVAVQVVTTWLDLAAETGKDPGSRLVGRRCGYSHTTVNEALGRFRDYLGQPSV